MLQSWRAGLTTLEPMKQLTRVTTSYRRCVCVLNIKHYCVCAGLGCVMWVWGAVWRLLCWHWHEHKHALCAQGANSPVCVPCCDVWCCAARQKCQASIVCWRSWNDGVIYLRGESSRTNVVICCFRGKASCFSRCPCWPAAWFDNSLCLVFPKHTCTHTHYSTPHAPTVCNVFNVFNAHII